MKVVSRSPKVLLMLAALAVPGSASFAQDQDSEAGVTGSVTDTSVPPVSEMTKGPEIEGIISARSGARMQITTADGAKSVDQI
jgi:OOP family OmpA-OmpF porin